MDTGAIHKLLSRGEAHRETSAEVFLLLAQTFRPFDQKLSLLFQEIARACLANDGRAFLENHRKLEEHLERMGETLNDIEIRLEKIKDLLGIPDVRTRYEAGQRKLASYELDLPAGVTDLYDAAWWWEYQAREGKEVPELPGGLRERYSLVWGRDV